MSLTLAPTSPPRGTIGVAAGGAAGGAVLAAADLDRRFTACAIDRLLCWGVAAGVGFAAWRLLPDDRWAALAALVVTAATAELVLAVVLGTTGLTPGKAAGGLRVVRRMTGRPIGVGAALGRQVVLGVAGLPTAGLGLATLAWSAATDPTGERRGLHDRIGDAIVLDVRPRPTPTLERPPPHHEVVNLTAMRLLPTPSSPVFAPPTAPLAVATPAGSGAWPSSPGFPPAAVPPPSAPHPGEVAPPPAWVDPPTVRIDRLPHAPALERTLERSAAEVAAMSAGVAQWRVAFDTGERFVVQGLAIVGRRPEARPGESVQHVIALPSSDMSLSKTHVQFQVAPDGALVVMDRGSTNGSYVVRMGLSRSLTPGRPSTLIAGDVVRFGDRSMRVDRA